MDQLRDVPANGNGRNSEPLRDRRGGVPASQHPKHLGLARGQSICPTTATA
jgi:hypothetical protein